MALESPYRWSMNRLAILLPSAMLLTACTGADPIIQPGASASPSAGLATTSSESNKTGSGSSADATALPTIANDAKVKPVTTFKSCDDLLAHLKSEALKVVDGHGLPTGLGPYAVSGGKSGLGELFAEFAQGGETTPGDVSAEKASDNHSTTNTQEAEVGEFTNTVTNGKVIATVVDTYRSDDGLSVRILNPQDLSELGKIEPQGTQSAQKLSVAFANEHTLLVLEEEATKSGDRTVLSRVDLQDPSSPKVTSSIRMNGQTNAVRLVSGKVVIASTAEPQGLAFKEPLDKSVRGERDAIDHNKQVIQDSTIAQWQPDAEILDASGKPVERDLVLTKCDQIAMGEQRGFAMTSVVSIDPSQDTLKLNPGAAIIGHTAGVYASSKRLVTWTPNYETASRIDNQLATFKIDNPDAITLGTSGAVQGHIPGPWAVDEEAGIVRIASTMMDATDKPVSQVTIFQEQDKALAPVGHLDGLGHDEEIKAIRWLTPSLGVMVTFKQTDPVYTIDTTNPTRPKKAGELKIPGYSAYLHPVGKDRLLGIGQQADSKTGQALGFKYSLFDISDLSAPKELDSREFAGATSEAEYDHQGFTWFNNRGYVAFANHASPNNEKADYNQLTISGVQVTNDKLEVLGSGMLTTEQAWSGAQTVVINDKLYAVNTAAIGKYEANTIKEEQQRTLP